MRVPPGDTMFRTMIADSLFEQKWVLQERLAVGGLKA
jgi:hypothetical protein